MPKENSFFIKICLAAFGFILGMIILGWSYHEISIVQLVYGFLLFIIISIGLFALLILKESIFSPFLITLAGFVFFYCLTPILNPGCIEALVDLEGNISGLFLILFISIAALTAGYYAFKGGQNRWIHAWISRPIDSKNLYILTVTIIALYLLSSFVQARAVNIKFLDLFLINRYSSEVGMFRTDTVFYYLDMINMYLVLSISPLVVVDLNWAKKNIFLLVILIIPWLFIGFGLYNFSVRSRFAAYIISGLITYIFYYRPSRKFYLSAFLGSAGLLVLLVGNQYLNRKSMAYMYKTNDIALLLDEYTDQNVNLTMILEGIQNRTIDYLYGESYAIIPVQFVPRALYPNKPGGDDMYRKLASVNRFTYWNVSYGLPGEMIANFGIFGFPVGMFLYGAFLKFWWSLFIRHRNSALMIIFYSISYLYIFFTVRGNFAPMFSPYFYSCLFLFIISRIFTKSSRSAKI